MDKSEIITRAPEFSMHYQFFILLFYQFQNKSNYNTKKCINVINL